jgi:choice-of-anchor B domain-containing protein
MRAAIAAVLLLATSITAAHAQLIDKPRAAFGHALAFADNELLISEAHNNATPGFVYVYAKSGDKWVERAALKASDGRTADKFGSALARSGNRIIVGARNAAYIFEKSGTGWQQVARLAPADVKTEDLYAVSVAISGDVALVGAPGSATRAGAAYVYRRTGSGWTQDTRLTAPESKEQMLFGAAVGMKDGDLLISEHAHNERTGGVHVFRRDGNAWKHYTRLLHTNAQKNDRFGGNIAINGDRVLIAATGFLSNSGAVFSFERRPDGSYREVQRILAFDGRSGEQFGLSIGADGDNLWVGAPFAKQARGKVYHFFRSAPDEWSVADPMVYDNLAQGDTYGLSVAAQGLVAAVGIPNDDVHLGSVVVYEFNREQRRWVPSLLQRNASVIASKTDGKKECINAHAAEFECKDMELLSYLSTDDLGAGRGMMAAGVWGWTDPQTGKEWALVGRMDGVSFVDISNPEKPSMAANVPITKGAHPNYWKEIKVYKNHAYITADGAGAHGMQIFDLTRLRNVSKMPAVFEPDTIYRGVNSAHNIAINEETGFAFITGASGGGETCGGGLHMVDIRDPRKPVFAGCFSDPKTGRASTGYSHDALCVVYKGPDASYRGREICLGSNETMLSIADVTDKKNTRAVSRASYPNVGYLHQGWWSEDQRYFYVNDELDEVSGTVTRTRTIIFDLVDLDDPQVAAEFMSPTSASDHNLYIKGDTMYQSHYKAGLRIVDIKDRTKPVEVGYFDTVPYGENTPGFGGSWGSYPYFKSGTIVTTSMSEGLFVLRKKAPAKPVL